MPQFVDPCHLKQCEQLQSSVRHSAETPYCCSAFVGFSMSLDYNSKLKPTFDRANLRCILVLNVPVKCTLQASACIF